MDHIYHGSIRIGLLVYIQFLIGHLILPLWPLKSFKRKLSSDAREKLIYVVFVHCDATVYWLFWISSFVCYCATLELQSMEIPLRIIQWLQMYVLRIYHRTFHHNCIRNSLRSNWRIWANFYWKLYYYRIWDMLVAYWLRIICITRFYSHI